MPAPRPPLLAIVVLLTLALPTAAAAKPQLSATTTHSMLTSRELWATIDVCNAPDQPNTLGIRGSMPEDGRSTDRMYMSFRLQYLDRASMRWLDLAGGGTPAFVAVGGGGSPRQGGRSFQLVPVAGKPAFSLRGVVSFQWRRGKAVLESTSRVTTVGRHSLAGADPADYSAATCLIG
jgi:hypothetical protein